MSRYLVRRLLTAIPTLLLISFVLYAVLSLAPGDPLSQFAANPAVPPEVRDNIRRSLGLDQPWPVRYVKWLLALAQGDWGYSFGSRIPVFATSHSAPHLSQRSLRGFWRTTITPTLLSWYGEDSLGTLIAVLTRPPKMGLDNS